MGKVKLSYELDMKQPPKWITVTPSAVARGSFHFVQEVGDFYAGPNYYTERKGLSSFLLKVVLSGKGLMTYRGQTYTLLPGQFFWLDCLDHQYYRTAPDAASWHILWVHFHGANSANYYEQFLALNSGSCTGELSPGSAVADHIRTILSAYSGGQNTLAQELRISALITDIMAECIASCTVFSESTHGMPSSVEQARAYLLDHYAEHITLDTLSEQFSIDKFYFQKLFKRHIGLTPNEFVILTRLNHAKELLRTTDRKVVEIAQDVGVSNPSHFINLFHKHEGVTPGVYRQSWYSR